MAGVKILGYGNGAHQQAGFQPGQQVGNLLDQCANWQVANLSLQLMTKKPHFGVRIARLSLRDLCRDADLYFLPGKKGVLVVNFLELPDLVLKGTAEETT